MGSEFYKRWLHSRSFIIDNGNEMDNGSTQPWLVSADDGSLSDAIKSEEPSGTRTLPKPSFLLETRGPKITEAALEIFGRESAPQKPDNPKLIHLPQAAESPMGLFPFVELENQSLSNVNPSEWVMVEVIADSGACETVLPKHLCNNIKLRESVGSKAGVEYEVASGKAVKNLGERHCEVYCEGAGNSMMMHFQVADIHRPLLSLSRAADQGFRSVLDQHGGYLEDTQSGEQIPIQRRGNLYIMQIWIRAGSDERPPDNSQHFVGRG